MATDTQTAGRSWSRGRLVASGLNVLGSTLYFAHERQGPVAWTWMGIAVVLLALALMLRAVGSPRRSEAHEWEAVRQREVERRHERLARDPLPSPHDTDGGARG